jgi:hypothetical protein
MGCRRTLAGVIASLFLCAGILPAAAPPDPLRLVSNQADLVIRVEHPRALIDRITAQPLVQQVLTFDAVRELLDSTNAHRGQQLLGYFEKQLGVDRMELLDRLTKGGIALGIKLGPQPAPTLLVVQGQDDSFIRRFFTLAQGVLEQELARQESKDRVVHGTYRGIDVIHVGKDLHAAVAGAALLVGNKERALQLGLDLHLDGDKKSLAKSDRVNQARQRLGTDALVWLWLNLDTVRQAPGAKEIFRLPRNDAQLTVLAGGLLDIVGRSPFVCAGAYADSSGAAIRVQMPCGRDGMPAALALHVPLNGQAGSRQLLEPKGVLASSSYYLDLAKIWEDRNKLFNKKQVEGIESFDTKSRIVLGSSPLSKLLALTGPYHRFVVAERTQSEYKNQPVGNFPAFGLVIELRDPGEFNRRMESVLRGAALLATTQVKLRPFEDKYAGRKIIGYRFAEDKPYPADVDNIRFNFTPCFVVVGNQFVVCTTQALCRELVDNLNKEISAADARANPQAEQTRLYASGGADLLDKYRDRVFTQAILDRAIPPAEATSQVQALVSLVRRLGTIQIESEYGQRDFRYELRLKLAP